MKRNVVISGKKGNKKKKKNKRNGDGTLYKVRTIVMFFAINFCRKKIADKTIFKKP